MMDDNISENYGDEDLRVPDLGKLHTTPGGELRVRRNLGLPEHADVVGFCRDVINEDCAVIERRGKNWYIYVPFCRITVNVSAHTIITAHKNSQRS